MDHLDRPYRAWGHFPTYTQRVALGWYGAAFQAEERPSSRKATVKAQHIIGPLKYGLLLTLLLTTACAQKAPTDCFSNADCAESDACVDSRCISEPIDCEVLGVFDEKAEIVPQHATLVTQMSVTLDDRGLVHYCYSGFDDETPIAYYGRQLNGPELAEEEALTIEENPVSCGGIAIAEDGTPFILARSPGAVMYRVETPSEDEKATPEVSWESLELTRLQSSGAKAALRGDDTVVSLTRDDKNGIFLGLSLGYQVAFQPLYIAHVTKKDGLEVLVNGWEEDDDPSVVGFAPQVMMLGDTPYMIVGRMFQSSVWLSDLELEIAADVEGAYPIAGKGRDDTVWSLYSDHNDNLVVSKVQDKEFVEVGKLAQIDTDFNLNGRLPWDLSIDRNEVAHVLFSDVAQGANALVYQNSDANGLLGTEQIVTTSLTREIPGNFLYDINTDMCGRPTIAVVENSQKSYNDESDPSEAKDDEQSMPGHHPVVRVISMI